MNPNLSLLIQKGKEREKEQKIAILQEEQKDYDIVFSSWIQMIGNKIGTIRLKYFHHKNVPKNDICKEVLQNYFGRQIKFVRNDVVLRDCYVVIEPPWEDLYKKELEEKEKEIEEIKEKEKEIEKIEEEIEEKRKEIEGKEKKILLYASKLKARENS